MQIWLVEDGLTEKEQLKAPKGTVFIPFSPFPPDKVRRDCYYHTTPAMVAPKSLENLHSCEVNTRKIKTFMIFFLLHLSVFKLYVSMWNRIGWEEEW